MNFIKLPFEKRVEFGLGFFVVLFTGWLVWLGHLQRGDFDQTSKRQLRAFVQVIEPELVSVDPFRIKFQLKNTGQTTAHDVMLRVNFEVVDNDSIDSLPNPKFWTTDGWPRVLGSNVSVQIFSTPSRDPMSNAGYDSQKQRIFFYGIVRYKDIYGENHWTTFCFRHVELHRFLEVHKQFNEADGGFLVPE